MYLLRFPYSDVSASARYPTWLALEPWSGNRNYRPTKSELAWAKELIELYSRQKVEKLLPKVVSRMKQKDGFPNAKNFGATRLFFPMVCKVYDLEIQRRRDDQLRASEEVIENRNDSESRQNRKCRREELLQIWEKLSFDEQNQIEQQALEQQKGTMLKQHFQKNDEHRQRECLKVLDQHETEWSSP